MTGRKAGAALVATALLASLSLSGCQVSFTFPPERKAPEAPPVTEPAPRGIYHPVARGETLWSISRAYGHKPATLMEVNDLEGETIYEGQRLFIPGAAEAVPAPPATPPPPPEPPPAEVTFSPALDVDLPEAPPPEDALPAPAEATPIIREPAPISTDEPATVPEAETPPPAREEDGTFSWPCPAVVTGLDTDPERSHALLLGVRPGEFLRATAGGQIIFSGQTRDFGSTMIIEHRDNMFTIYGGDIEPLLPADTPVTRGMIIGRISGAPGDESVLKLEIRRGTEAIAPGEVFGGTAPPTP